MDVLIHNFMTQMYWIDISVIVVFTLIFALWIGLMESRSILKKNLEYNAQLFKLRKEIYDECEKNFFL